jgi:hypothetical protein
MTGLAITPLVSPAIPIDQSQVFADLPIKSKRGRLHSAFRVPRSGDARGELLSLLIVEIMNLLYHKAPRALVVFRRKRTPNLPLHPLCHQKWLIIMHAQSYYLQHFRLCIIPPIFLPRRCGTVDDHCCGCTLKNRQSG